MRNDSAAQSGVPNTERSEQKVQGHAPGQGQGVKPIAGSRDRVPCGYRAKPCRSMRQSLIRRKPTKRCRQKKKKYKFSSSTKQTSKHKPAPLYYLLIQSKIRKERSDFAAVECGGKSVGANSVRPPLFAYMVCTNSNLAAPQMGRRGRRPLHGM